MVAKGEPTGMGKFSPSQQPEGPAPYELGITAGEQAGALHLRAQPHCMTQPLPGDPCSLPAPSTVCAHPHPQHSHVSAALCISTIGSKWNTRI